MYLEASGKMLMRRLTLASVPTGNLVPYDWGETGVMENVRA
jgi:hypothetical protein